MIMDNDPTIESAQRRYPGRRSSIVGCALPRSPACPDLTRDRNGLVLNLVTGTCGSTAFATLLPPGHRRCARLLRRVCGPGPPIQNCCCLRHWPPWPDLPERALSSAQALWQALCARQARTLLIGLALAQQRRFTHAWTMLHAAELDTDRAALAWFVGDTVMADWLYARLREIRIERLRRPGHAPAVARRSKPPSPAVLRHGLLARAQHGRRTPAVAAATQAAVADLPRLEARLDIAFELANPDAIEMAGTEADPMAFRLRGELVRLSLFEGFDELLCLPALQGVEAHWYQIETVRKVLKQYRGRVLLADEVGLGKTIEAGMVLKEYMLRGMAERMLILTPASLVGQWRDEMASKFGIEFATSHDPLLRSDPAAFWAQPRVIASIAVGAPAGAGRVARRLELRCGGGRRGPPPARPDECELPAGERPAEALSVAAVGDAGAEQPARAIQPVDTAAARHLQDAEGVPLRLHGSRQAARTGEPRAAARLDAQCDGAQHARARGLAHATAASIHAARRPRSGGGVCATTNCRRWPARSRRMSLADRHSRIGCHCSIYWPLRVPRRLRPPPQSPAWRRAFRRTPAGQACSPVPAPSASARRRQP